MQTKREVLETKSIAHELGVSPKTVKRLHREHRLPGSYKLGGVTSPIRMHRDDLERLKRGKR
jgi:predicted DNA-binding transcriptional regulator AlpA